MKVKTVPNDESGLKEVAKPAISRHEDTTAIDFSGDFVSYFIHIQDTSDSHALSEPELTPFVERGDVLEALREMGFRDENVHVKSSVSLRAPITDPCGEDAKYKLATPRCRSLHNRRR